MPPRRFRCGVTLTMVWRVLSAHTRSERLTGGGDEAAPRLCTHRQRYHTSTSVSRQAPHLVEVNKMASLLSSIVSLRNADAP